MIGYEGLLIGVPTLAAAPMSIIVPLFTGTAATDQTLTGVIGAYSGTLPITLTHQWQQYSGSVWSDISGATSIDYAIQSGDVGKTVRRAETATNAAGSITTYTAASDTVATSYYVSKSGNNSNDGLTPATAKLTLANILGAAGVPIGGNAAVWVGDGEYVENTAGRLLLNRTYTSRVLVKAINAGAVSVKGTGADSASVLVASNATNVLFDGILFDISSGSTYTIWYANAAAGINAVQFKNGSISNNATNGYGVRLLNVSGTDFLFENMEITATGSGGIGVGASGKSTSARINGLRLVNCDVTGVARSFEIDTQGWIDNLYVSGHHESTRLSPAGLAIGTKAGGLTGDLNNVTLENVTIDGNGTGIELGGTSTGSVNNLTITGCNVDATANKQIGIMLRGNINGLTYTNNTVSGGYIGGFGGFGSEGTNTDFVIEDSAFSSVEPAPGEGSLAAGFGGVTGFQMRRCTFDGEGRGWTLQDNMHDVVCEDWESTATDYGFRIGHDAVNDPHTTSGVIIRRFEIVSLDTNGFVVGEGVQDVLIEDGSVSGGRGCMRLRGHATNDNVLIRRIGLSRNPLGTTDSPMIEMLGTQNTTLTDCDIESDEYQVFSADLEGVLQLANVEITGNRIAIGGGSVYAVGVGTLGTNVVFDSNAYTVSGGATFGTLLGTTVADLPAARVAWDGYGDGTNDDLSTAA